MDRSPRIDLTLDPEPNQRLDLENLKRKRRSSNPLVDDASCTTSSKSPKIRQHNVKDVWETASWGSIESESRSTSWTPSKKSESIGASEADSSSCIGQAAKPLNKTSETNRITSKFVNSSMLSPVGSRSLYDNQAFVDGLWHTPDLVDLASDVQTTPTKLSRRCSKPGTMNGSDLIKHEPPNIIDLTEVEQEEDDDIELVITGTCPGPLSKLESAHNTTAVGVTEDDNTDDSDPMADDQRFSTIMTDADYMTEDELGQWLQQLSLLESSSAPKQPPSPRPAPGIEIESVYWKSSKLHPGKSVELDDGGFLRIERIYITAVEDIILTGRYMIRENCLKSLMPKRRNELVWVIELSAEQAEFGCVPDPVEVSMTRIKRLRQIVFTNHTYGTMCHKDCMTEYRSVAELAQEGPLFCRWKRTTVDIERRLPLEESICALSIDEADEKARGRTVSPRTEAGALRSQWRGSTAFGGSHVCVHHSTDLDGRDEMAMYQQYTFGDAFCGAGGVSSGAQAAGLCLRWAFDHDSAAIATYQRNFASYGVSCLQHSVDVFLQHANLADGSTDILHMSPPCQPFSPAHTIPNEIKDETNQAALFSVLHLLQRIKPRVATVEETEGLISRHDQWFSVLINIFTSQGYSVRWRVVRCEQFGVPQTRKRLFIIAAGPGEKLPSMPKATHGLPGSGLKPLVTINDRIRDIPMNAMSHNTNVMFEAGRRPLYNGNILARTITCNGGIGNYHPSGRPYTIRELASLQTLPILHDFSHLGITAARRQIGNMVPPVLAKALFQTIVKSLKETDGIETR